MVCFLTLHAASAANAHPSFKAKGITTHTAAPLKDLLVMGVALEPQVAYGNYVQNISTFVAATNRQHTLNANASAVSLTGSTRPVFPLPAPLVSFVPRVKFSADGLDKFVEKLAEMQPMTETTGKTTKIILQKPLLDKCLKLEQVAQEYSMTSPGEILLVDLPQYNWLLRVVAEFLATNTYPAFSTSTGENLEAIPTRWSTADTIIDGYVKFTGAAGRSAMEKLQKEIAKARDGSKEDVVTASEEWKNIATSAYNVGESLLDQDSVLVCKASPVPMSFNVGSISEHPGNYPGILFPYFNRMNIPDKVTLRRIVYRHFFRILGDTSAACLQRWKSMRSSLDRLSGTTQGMVLAHIFYGIDLSLQTQTRMFVIMEDGEYLGFSLLGERFVIYDGQDFVTPDSYKSLNAQIADLSSHISALTRIAQVLSGCRIKGNEIAEVEVTVEDISTASKLITEIQKRKLEEEQEDAITAETDHLRFREPYYRNTPDRIIWVLDMLTKLSDEPIGPLVPQFIPSDLSLLDDRLFRLLAAFGPDAPSLYNGTGKDTFKLPFLTTEADGKLVVSKDAVIPPKLHIAMKGIMASHSDWRKVLKDRKIQMDFKERAGKSRCAVIQSKDSVHDIFYGLCAWMTKVGPKAQKRKRDIAEVGDEDAGDGQPRPAKRGPAVSTEAEALALFD